jgi:hypothetical protein
MAGGIRRAFGKRCTRRHRGGDTRRSSLRRVEVVSRSHLYGTSAPPPRARSKRGWLEPAGQTSARRSGPREPTAIMDRQRGFPFLGSHDLAPTKKRFAPRVAVPLSSRGLITTSVRTLPAPRSDAHACCGSPARTSARGLDLTSTTARRTRIRSTKPTQGFLKGPKESSSSISVRSGRTTAQSQPAQEMHLTPKAGPFRDTSGHREP